MRRRTGTSGLCIPRGSYRKGSFGGFADTMPAMKCLRTLRRSVTPALWVILVTSSALPIAAAEPGTAQAVSKFMEPVEQGVTLAEKALADHEDELAESYYRLALLDTWIRLGVVDLADADLSAAREDLFQATRAAAKGTWTSEVSLALVQLRMGETGEALAALRTLAARRSSDLRTREHLVQALVLAGEVEEAGREIENLRAKNPEPAVRLERMLAETEGDAQGRRLAFLPKLSAGPIAEVPAAERLRLRSLLTGTQGLAYRNLAVLQERAGRPLRAAASAARADELDPPRSTAEKRFLGTVDLREAPPFPAVEPLRADEATVWKTAKVELLPALQAIRAGKPEEAEAFLRQALEKGDDPPARDMLAILLVDQERYDEAEKQLLAAIAAAGDSVVPMREHLARLYLMRGREDAAVEQLRAAAPDGDLERDLAWKLIEAELAAGNATAAKDLLRSFTQRFRSPRAYLKLAELEDAKTAATLLREAEGLAPSSEEILTRSAHACLDAGFVQWAADSLGSLLRILPEVAEYHYLFGEVRLRLGNLTGGEESLRRAVELDPSRLPARLALARAYLRLERPGDARAELDEVLRLDPENAEAKALLAEAE